MSRLPSTDVAGAKRSSLPRVLLAVTFAPRARSAAKVASRILLPLAQGLDVVLVDLSAAVRRHVEHQVSTTPERVIVDVHQLGGRLDLGVFRRVVEPAGPDRDVHFGGQPVRTGPLAEVQVPCWRCRAANRPRSSVAQQVSPAKPDSLPTQRHVRAAVAEHAGLGLQLADDLPVLGQS